ncbi:MAG: electron transport complex subunit E [bacterium]|nr:electron transport complex subunit E [bacterium]
MSVSTVKEVTKGFWEKNPVLVLALGLCPSLAVTTSVRNALGMGVSTIFVLTLSNVIIALIKGIVPSQIRIPCYIIVIATLVTIVDLVLAAYFPDISKAIGLFIKLIVVNCIILGRAEAFAAKNTAWRSLLDGIGMGIGFMIALVLIAAVREVLGANKLFGFTVFPGWRPIAVMVLAPGAFLTLGFLLGAKNLRMRT